MKIHYILSIIIGVVLPTLLSAQIFDKDSVFILERKTLELGKTISGKNKKLVKGFGVRVSTGIFSNNVPDENYVRSAAVIPYSLEFGYRYSFLELGVRHFVTGPALGTDSRWASGPLSPTLLTSYTIPVNMGIQGNAGVLTLHLKVFKMPFFVNFSAGRNDFTFSDKALVQNYYADGTVKYLYRPSTSFPGARLKNNTRSVGVGFEKGPLIGGVEWSSMKQWNYPEEGSRFKEKYQYMYMGVQVNTGKKKGTKTPHADIKNNFQLGVSKMALLAPWRHSGSSTGWSVDFTYPFGPKYTINGSAQLTNQSHGNDKYIPKDNNVFPFNLNNPAGEVTRYLLYAGMVLNPDQEFKWNVYAGEGYYRIKKIPVDYWIDYPAQNLYNYDTADKLGMCAGLGFEYQYIHAQILMHKPFSSFPVLMEWNMGAKIHF